MKRLRIVQGGITNQDKELLEELAANGGSVSSWVVPKDSCPRDDVVVYVAPYGFFATAVVDSFPKPKKKWEHRYGASLTHIKLIEPAISLAAIRRHIPMLKWANYPRSIHTPDSTLADGIRAFIRHRRKTGLPDLDDASLHESNIDELRKVALMSARGSVPARQKEVIHRARSLAIKLYVLRRADGLCEYCGEDAPFRNADGRPYLEPHHTTRLADEGPDHPSHVIALCPNCHRRAHHADDADTLNRELKRLLKEIESA